MLEGGWEGENVDCGKRKMSIMGTKLELTQR